MASQDFEANAIINFSPDLKIISCQLKPYYKNLPHMN